ncbi:hypothetical protein J7E63_26315 [Bacillus sp. ISL-75]|uniref:hypothetical protein n=1 Tax=Bacillus sp. ISL-75 TaxID=2819137 RepID=UPI001BE9ED56|nr:hypothetical protein [Bacillus sp. ISL-75]MBT2730354.1 hypothetical protein [Bacillus sp. ISL-75]
MANVKFEKNELTRSAAGVKRTFRRQAKNGKFLDQKLNKTDALNKISSSLKVSIRSLYSGDRKDYLDEWYRELLIEIEEINQHLLEENGESSKDALRIMKVDELINMLEEKNNIIQAYNLKVEKLQIQVEKLMKKDITRYEKIDSHSS